MPWRTDGSLSPRCALSRTHGRPRRTDLDRRIAYPRPSRSGRRHARGPRRQGCRLWLSRSAGAVLRFDVGSLTLSSPPPNDDLTFAPHREGLTIDGWRDRRSPTLAGRPLPLARVRHRPKPRCRSGCEALFPRLEFRPDGVRRRGNAEMAAAEPKRGLGGQRQRGWAHCRRGLQRRRDPLASRRRRARVLALQVLPNGKQPADWDWVL